MADGGSRVIQEWQAGKEDELYEPQVCSDNRQCCSSGEKQILKLGKYVKTNIKIKLQEQWPHLNVLCKYAKRTTFENLELDAFIAGETRTIINMQDKQLANGRLRFLSLLMHWLCRCKDWGLVKSMYEAVMESIETGEETWNSNFGHYETMIPVNSVRPQEGRNLDTRKRPDVYWCKQYQKKNCSEKSPHMMQLKPDENPVPVIHMCAACLQREGKMLEHPEVECMEKKG